MTSTESENRSRKILQEMVADHSGNVMCENSEGEKTNLGDKTTLLVKNSLTKVKKGAVLFESRKVKAKLNDKRVHYNHDTKAVARMVTELLILDKGSGEAVAVVLTLNMEEKSLTLSCFGEDRGALLLKIFLAPFLVQLEEDEVSIEGRPGEERWRVAANGRKNDSWRRPGNAEETRRKPDGLSNGGEAKVMEQRMAKLALAEISQQKLRDADAAGRRQQSCKKVESEEKVMLRAERKRKEEEVKKKKGEEARMREEAELKKLEKEKDSEMEILKEKARLMGTFCQQLLALSPENGVRLLRKREVEDGLSRQEIGRELLKTLATLVLEGREEIEKEEEAVKGETCRVSFEEKNVVIGNSGDQEGVALGDSSIERNLPGGGILKCKKTSVDKTDLEKEAVKRCSNF